MPYDEDPEFIDWEDTMPPQDSRFLAFAPAVAIAALADVALLGCRPRQYYGWRDYYTCSPKYVCRPLPY